MWLFDRGFIPPMPYVGARVRRRRDAGGILAGMDVSVEGRYAVDFMKRSIKVRGRRWLRFS